jgi:hypothetical protein
MSLQPVHHRQERGPEEYGEQGGDHQCRERLQHVREADEDDGDADEVPAGDAGALEPVGDEAVTERLRRGDPGRRRIRRTLSRLGLTPLQQVHMTPTVERAERTAWRHPSG